MSTNYLAYGIFEKFKFGSDGKLVSFGALVPKGMGAFKNTTGAPLLIMPYGPPGNWIEQGHEGAASSAYGKKKRAVRFGQGLEDKKVNPSGYLATWYGEPRTLPPSWNPLLMQGANNFVEGVNSPKLSNVVAFGKKKKITRKKLLKKKTVKV